MWHISIAIFELEVRLQRYYFFSPFNQVSILC